MMHSRTDFLGHNLMLSFSTVYITPRVRASLHKIVQTQQHKKFWDLVSKLKDGRFDIPGLKVEKLYSKKSTKLFSARMSREMRLIFSMKHERSGYSLIIHELNHHDDAYDSIERIDTLENNLQEANKLLLDYASITNEQANLACNSLGSGASAETGQLFKVPSYLLDDPDKYIQFEKSLDRYLDLSEEQKDILAQREKVFLVQGPAGTGKTTLALFWLLSLYEEHRDDLIYLFTYHEELACVCRAYKVNLVGEDDSKSKTKESGIKVFSYIDFCRKYLRQCLKKEERARLWLSQKQSIDILRQIISSKPRWARTLVAEDFYGLIYSIFKGRFMPGTESLPASKDDYEHIFKDYGRMPESFEDSLEVFAQYQNRLEKNGWLDEADVIRMSYDSLKRNALLAAAERRLWIVIDEVQDFSELEWKSILLFWENHCLHYKGSPSFPFLAGDINQNISRSGFRWQELESYLQSILRNLHRPNSLKKVTLHQNYRNTRQIHQLATFVRNFGSDTSDLGLAPELEGEQPRLIIASDQELLSFLQDKESRNQLFSPLVVLVENDDSLNFLRKELADSQAVFLLPLRASKGMEFEDVIIHRAFSSNLVNQAGAIGAESSRLFDLWYMGITRARKNLLIIQNKDDNRRLADLLQERETEFYQFVELLEPVVGFSQFWNKREHSTPDYNVIFLERKLAQDLWDIFLKEQLTATADKSLSDYGQQCRERALALWRRCLDYGSLGRALLHLKNFAEAASYLKRAGLLQEAASSMEAAELYPDAAHEYELLGLTSDAARCYEYAQNYLNAARLHEEEGSWLLAAQNYHSAGELTKAALACENAGMHRSAADIYKANGKYQKAAELYERIEDYLSAGQMYLRVNNKLDAAHCFQKAGKLDKALELYEALQQWGEAAQAAASLAEAVGDPADVGDQTSKHAKAASLFLKAGRLLESAQSLEAAHLSEKAADLYLEIKDYSSAAKLYENAGLHAQSALMYEKAGLWQKALDLAADGVNELLEARMREKLGDYQTAASIFEKSQAFSEAAYCLEKANDFARAADLYLKIENKTQAANCLARIDRRMDAAKLYVVSGQISSAYELVLSTKPSVPIPKDEESFKLLLAWCLETKRTAAAAQLLELKQDYLAAADKFRECIMLAKAAECLKKFGRPGEAGILYRQLGDMEKAADCFKQAKQWQDVAKCLEQMQKWLEAKEMYERCRDKAGIARCNNALNWF